MSIRFRGSLRLHMILLASSGAVLLGLPLAAGASVAPRAIPPQSAAELEAKVAGHLAKAQEILDGILAVKGARTVENTLAPFEDISIELDTASNISSLMENVHPDPALRTVAEKGSQDVQAFATALSLNRAAYDALVAVDVSATDAITRRLLEHSLRDYRRSGVDRDEATRAKIQALRDELVQLGQEFDRNIRDDVRFVLLDPAELEGLPSDYIEAHPADESGKVKLTSRYPDYIPFMSYAKSGEARRRFYMEYKNRAYPQNKAVLEKLLAKRYELARLLGYPSWAHYVTEDKMAKTPETAGAFLEKLHDAAKDRAARDYAMLLERKRRDDPSAAEVADFEKSYYEELVKTEQFEFNSQELRDYYDFPRVKEGILDLTGRLFGVTFRPLEAPEVWHSSVEGYEVLEGDRLIGRFYLDLHPRDGKYSHAAQFNLVRGVADRQLPEAVLVCNFPGGEGSGPALMEHDDVETFLHEFGHLLHSLFAGHQKWIDLSGIATEWDFVEAPSQMLEEWALDPQVLGIFARHYQTGQAIPADLVEKLRTARDFGNGTWVTQQTFYSALSLNIYNRDASKVDLDRMAQELEEEYGSFRYVPGTHMYTSFGHLENYTAMYYTYVWSLVIAKDLFSRFDTKNLLDPRVAGEYRKKVLEPGGTQDAADLVRDFLGRPYNFDAFKAWLNRGAS